MSNIINELELSVRTSNVLKNMGDVHTMDDFLALTEGHVRAVRGAGWRVWQEIRSVQTDMRRQMDLRRQMREAEDRSAEDWTKRDEIALAVLPTVVQVCAGDRPREAGTETHEQMFSRKAYALADARLAARKTKEDDR